MAVCAIAALAIRAEGDNERLQRKPAAAVIITNDAIDADTAAAAEGTLNKRCCTLQHLSSA